MRFFSWIREAYRASAPLRAFYHVVAVISILFTVASLLYYGFFDHRQWVTERIAESYQTVEEKQTEVLQLILSTVPSRANQDQSPSAEELSALQSALVELSGSVTQVDTISAEMVEASDAYRGRISELAGALVRYDPTDPSTQGELLLAVDRWDRAARDYADAVEGRIGRFTRTLLPSV